MKNKKERGLILYKNGLRLTGGGATYLHPGLKETKLQLVKAAV